MRLWPVHWKAMLHRVLIVRHPSRVVLSGLGSARPYKYLAWSFTFAFNLFIWEDLLVSDITWSVHGKLEAHFPLPMKMGPDWPTICRYVGVLYLLVVLCKHPSLFKFASMMTSVFFHFCRKYFSQSMALIILKNDTKTFFKCFCPRLDFPSSPSAFLNFVDRNFFWPSKMYSLDVLGVKKGCDIIFYLSSSSSSSL